MERDVKHSRQLLLAHGEHVKVIVVRCGQTANASEELAIEYLQRNLRTEAGDEEWFLLTNLAFSVTQRMQSDEIDIIAIGPPGLRVIEVKHWSGEWIAGRHSDVEREADLVTTKAKKVGTTLRKHLRDLPHVAASFFLTQDASKVKRFAGETVRGVTLNSWSSWRDAIGLGGSPALGPQDSRRLSQLLAPRSLITIDGDLRRFAGYVNLDRQSPKDERFHRLFRGRHATSGDRVVLHLYDLSASDEKSASVKARREFETLHKLQLHPWAPRILDSFQDAPGYPGEMSFFTVVDPAAPSIGIRSEDETWPSPSRIEFARNAVLALEQFHQAQAGGQSLIHRNLTPRTILVRHDNTPMLTAFDRTRVPSEASVASGAQIPEEDRATTSPEVLVSGLGAADCRSDIYSLCASLTVLFQGEDALCHSALNVLAEGTADVPTERATLKAIEAKLALLLGISQPRPAAPPARFWTEGQVVPFHDHDYRIVNKLGSGGVGTTFKVIEIDRSTKEDLGTYVAKVIRDEELGRQILRAHGLARSHLGRHSGLSAIFEVAKEWRENGFVALLAWVDGAPLAEFTGIFPLLAEDLQEVTAEDLAIRWIKSVCRALDVLHRNGLVHGDVSPRNLIVSGSDLVLTDFDFVAKVGEKALGTGTVPYSAPASGPVRVTSPSDDIYALAASMFHVVYEREPFRHSGQYEKSSGISWGPIDRAAFRRLNAFLERATDPEPTRRFASAEAVDRFLKDQCAEPVSSGRPSQSPTPEPHPISTPAAVELREGRVAWLREVLSSYPGSPSGNQETRGLDTTFASATYVETAIETTLLRDIKSRRLRLVVLCGNAGDGKTASRALEML